MSVECAAYTRHEVPATILEAGRRAEEDAIARMEELGHTFYVFVDAETERIPIVYRRSDGDYGVIEPMVGGGYSAARR